MRTAPLLVLAGCLHTPQFPGPLGPLGREIAPPPLPTDVPAPIEVKLTRPSPRLPDGTDHPDAVAKAARYFLDHQPQGFTDDCTGFVCATYDRVGADLHGNVITMWTAAKKAGAIHHHKLPNVGDIAFFDGTIDRNRDGKQNDPLTHVALVLEVDRDTGDILLAHGGYAGGQRTLFHMNLLQPQSRTDADGNVINDSMRRPKPSDAAGTKYLGSELWVGFGTYRAEDAAIWEAERATKVTDL